MVVMISTGGKKRWSGGITSSSRSSNKMSYYNIISASSTYFPNPMSLLCLLLCIVIANAFGEQDSCTAIEGTTCACEYRGKIVNLAKLDEQHYIPLTAKNASVQFYFSPCKPLGSANSSVCQNAAVCQKVGVGNQTAEWYAAGQAAPPEYTGSPDGQLKFIYKTMEAPGDPNVFRQSSIEMICNHHVSSPVLNYINQTGVKHDRSDPIVYSFTLAGKSMCAYELSAQGGISAGSVLLILFFVGVFVYLVGGVLVKKCVMGSVGLEALPHFSFWSDLPGLVKDGCLFTFSCGCYTSNERSQGYDDI